MHKTPKKLSVKYVVENEGSQTFVIFFVQAFYSNFNDGLLIKEIYVYLIIEVLAMVAIVST